MIFIIINLRGIARGSQSILPAIEGGGGRSLDDERVGDVIVRGVVDVFARINRVGHAGIGAGNRGGNALGEIRSGVESRCSRLGSAIGGGVVEVFDDRAIRFAAGLEVAGREVEVIGIVHLFDEGSAERSAGLREGQVRFV